MKALVADIGGTNTRFALVDGASAELLVERHYLIADFPAIEAALETFLGDAGVRGSALKRLVLALPGPVKGANEVRLTNADWRVNMASLQKMFPAARIDFINDFEAAALGVLSVESQDMVELNPGRRRMNRGDIAVVLGAGTGLGTALLQCCEDGSYRTLSTEAGHMDFAPADAQQAELLLWLAQRFGHVSWERLVSGQGLVELYRFHAGEDQRQAPDARQVNRLATEQKDSAALQAVNTFVRIFAAYAGNLALAFKPAGGLYLVGGMTLKMVHWFDRELFNSVYADKGRMSHLASSFAVSLVNNEGTGLLGAARHAVSNRQQEDAA